MSGTALQVTGQFGPYVRGDIITDPGDIAAVMRPDLCQTIPWTAADEEPGNIIPPTPPEGD